MIKEWRGTAGPSIFIVVAGVLALAAPYLSVGKLHAGEVDVAHHYALVRTLMDFWGVPGVLPNLGEMNFYPRLSHWIAALVGHMTGSGLIAMSAVSVASTALIYFALLSLALQAGVASAVLSAVGLLALAWFEIGPRALFGHDVAANFFFAQNVATAQSLLVLWGLAAFNDRVPKLALDLLAVTAFAVIAFAHLMPALQFAGAYGVVLLVGAATHRTRASVLRIVRYAVLAGMVLAVHPTLPAMAQIADHQGALTFGFLMTDTIRVIIPLLITLISGALLIYGHRVRRTESYWLGSVGVAVGGLALLQLLVFHLVGRGSAYAVDKHFFAVVTFGVVNASMLAGLFISRRQLAMSPLSAATLGLAALAISHAALSSYVLEAREIHRYQKLVRDTMPSLLGKGRVVSNNAAMYPTINYLITIGDLRSPRDSIAYDVLNGQPPSAGKGVRLGFVGLQDPALTGRCVLRPYPVLNYRCLAKLNEEPQG
jgi:hypothetical protein